MSAQPIRVVSFDVGGVLGTLAGHSLSSALANASPHDADTVANVVRRHLHCVPRTNDELIRRVATDTGLSVRQVREILHTPRILRIDPRARALLNGLRDTCPDVRLVICSNLAATDHGHAALLRADLGDVLDATYFSCETGYAKGIGPVPFEHLARDLDVDLGEVVHVGDELREDVHGPLWAGCRALWLHSQRTVPERIAPHDRYRTATDLAAAVATLREWIPQSAPRPTLPVRAAALVHDTAHRLLIVRGPDDTGFAFPGGRCDAQTIDPPPEAAMRECYEELGTPIVVDRLLWTGWSHGESTRGENKIHYLFSGRLRDPSPVFAPEPTEVREHRWVAHDEALRMLNQWDADRLRRIKHGEAFGCQHRGSAG